jgi:hypothetical protein
MILVLYLTKTSLAKVYCWNGTIRVQGPDNLKCPKNASCVEDSDFDHDLDMVHMKWICKMSI